MNPLSLKKNAVWLFCLIVLSQVGCDPQPEASTSEVAPAPAIDTAQPTPEAAVAKQKPAPEPAATYSPPFEDRADLFAPPKRQQQSVRDDGTGESIELKGFVDVGGLRAVLAIGGVTAPLPVGAEKFGVQVISIAPPNAVLQRGRTRWTASLH